MTSRYSSTLPHIFKECLLSSVRKYVTKLFNLHDIAQNDSCDDLIQHVNGLILLKQYDMLDPMILETSAFANGDDTVTQIFKFLVTEHIEELTCRDLSTRMIEYLRILMEFQLSLLSSTIEMPVIVPEDTRSMTGTLMTLISTDTQVTSVDCTMIRHGEHFLNTFKSVIFKYMLTHVAAITVVFDDMRDKPSFLLEWIEDLLLFLRRHRHEFQDHVDATVNVILQHFTYLKDAVFNVRSRKERLINIYSIAVHLKSKPTEIMQNDKFYQWIQDQLMTNNDLEYKMKILKNFFICLTDTTDRDKLQVTLQTLKINGRSLCSNLSETSVNAMKVIGCFETLLVLLSMTRSMIMLKCVIHFAAGTSNEYDYTSNRLFNEKLEEHLRGYYYGASVEHVLESLQQTYREFMKLNIDETERLDILHGFLLPAFKFCDATPIERFFENNIQELKAIADLYIADDDVINQNIVSKIGCFQLITIMFARVGEDKIDANGTIAQNQILNQVLINRELFQKLHTSAINIRSLKITRPECQKLVRLLHCSAYNCSLAIVSLKKSEKYYAWAFCENYKEGHSIWKNIIDCSKQYKLGQTFKEYPKTCDITVNIKSTEVDRDGQQTYGYDYVHSYDLSACTLSEDINAYDLNKCVVLPANFRRSTSAMNSADSDPLRTPGASSIALQSNDFNEHECMPYICVLLRHIRKIFRVSDEQPTWLNGFLNIMQHNVDQNIQLYMLKIISNTADEVFKHYAKFVLTQIIKTITNYLKRYDLNYIVTDVLEIILDWHDVPSSEGDKAEAQKLFEVFIDKVIRKSSDNHRVYNYNLGLIRTMVKKWRSCLRVPSDFLNREMIRFRKSAPTTAVYHIFFNNDMTEEIVTRDDIINLLLSNWNTSKSDEMSLQCCECLGLYLRSLDNSRYDETERESKRCNMRKKILESVSLVSVESSHIIKQVKCIAVLCRSYPEMAVDYINIIIRAMAMCLARSHCLEIFALAMPKLNAKDIISNLCSMDLKKLLTKRVPACERLALQIVRDMVTIISPTDLLPYVNLAIPYIKDSITEHRELVYDILMRIHKKYSVDIAVDDDATVQNLLSISVRNLLTGLLDPSHDLQDRVLNFWTEETSLSEKSKDRLVALLAMHSPQMTTEDDAFAIFVALLMLQLATRSIDYNRKMFDAPLKDNCNFEEYKIAVSWRRRNLSCVTPMFVDSLASQMSYGTFSQSMDNDLRGTYVSSMRLSHGIPWRPRATQDLQFESIVFDDEDAADATTMLDISSHDPEFDRTTFASTSRQSLQTATGHERSTRILANTDGGKIFRNEQIRKNVQRAERIKQENIRQRSSVKLYR